MTTLRIHYTLWSKFKTHGIIYPHYHFKQKVLSYRIYCFQKYIFLWHIRSAAYLFTPVQIILHALLFLIQSHQGSFYDFFLYFKKWCKCGVYSLYSSLKPLIRAGFKIFLLYCHGRQKESFSFCIHLFKLVKKTPPRRKSRWC